VDSSKSIVDAIEKIAKARGVSMAQIGLAWLLSKDVVSAPIVGTTSLQNLEDLLGVFIDTRAIPLTKLSL
jgi:aryl-alcohol dehydrogenase-like predicted oxidoreductase